MQSGSRGWAFNVSTNKQAGVFAVLLVRVILGRKSISTRKETVKKIVFLLVLLSFTASYSYADEKRYIVPIDDSPVLGPADAPVTIIEFLDFQ